MVRFIHDCLETRAREAVLWPHALSPLPQFLQPAGTVETDCGHTSKFSVALLTKVQLAQFVCDLLETFDKRVIGWWIKILLGT